MSAASSELKNRLDFALAVAEEAGQLILGYYHDSDLAVDLKQDRTPVTAADRGAEQLIRGRIEKAFPSDGILGEEFGEKAAGNAFRWILDPVDGTKSFVHGVPLFGTLIGLEDAGEPVMGVCRFPALDEVVYAAKGSGTWWQTPRHPPRQTHVTQVGKLADALFCSTTVTGWDKVGRRDAFDKLCNATHLTRGWGDCFGHVLVATGRCDVMVDPQLNVWDCAALVPIMQEAGGHFVDWTGKVSIHSGNGVSVNALLKDAVLELLRK